MNTLVIGQYRANLLLRFEDDSDKLEAGGVTTVNNTKRIKGIVMGMTLGDGHLMIAKKGINACMRITHTEKQREYLEHKKALLEELTSVAVSEKPPRLPKHPNIEIMLTSRNHPLYTRTHKILYGTGTKRLTPVALSWLTPEGIALWYMDDGSLTKSYRTGSTGARFIANRTLWLNTCGFTLEEQQLIIDFFKKVHDIEFKLQAKTKIKGKQYYSLRTNAGNANKFIELVKPYIVPSMQYKIDMEYTYSR